MKIDEFQDIKLAGPVTRVTHPAFVGTAVQAPLTQAPDDAWKTEFGGWPNLSDYFARIQIEGPTLILYFGNRGRAGDVEGALDEVGRAIDAANNARRRETARQEEVEARKRQSSDEETSRLDASLARWNNKIHQ
jgi:hypothetical protein